MTPKQIQASQANGARSHGPATEQGKQKSARNSFRHGLLAETVVLEEESTRRFLSLLVSYMDEFQPRTVTEISLVESMAVARWRLLRVWGAQKTALDRDMALQSPSVGPAPVRVLLALHGSPETPCPPELLLRYEIAYDRQFSRALSRLLALQSRTADQPPQPYHPESPAGQTWKEDASTTTERTPEVIEDTQSVIVESGPEQGDPEWASESQAPPTQPRPSGSGHSGSSKPIGRLGGAGVAPQGAIR